MIATSGVWSNGNYKRVRHMNQMQLNRSAIPGSLEFVGKRGILKIVFVNEDLVGSKTGQLTA